MVLASGEGYEINFSVRNRELVCVYCSVKLPSGLTMKVPLTVTPIYILGFHRLSTTLRPSGSRRSRSRWECKLSL
jgi:hypothetical protein